MHLKNVLIAVQDMERAVRFYRDIFGLQVILDREGNVMMTEGLVLQDAGIWEQALGKELLPENNMTALYFEERDMDAFLRKLEGSGFQIRYAAEPEMQEGKRKFVRFYDPDGTLIEVGECAEAGK